MQELVVYAIVLAAAVYLARQWWPSKRGKGGCGDCHGGGCGENKAGGAARKSTSSELIQIGSGPKYSGATKAPHRREKT